jgi:DtxR family transcriptional regulator, Mn-dependent transcriptional regulator
MGILSTNVIWVYLAPMREKLTPQAEDYLKALHSLEQEGKVSTQALADHLDVAPASATQMLKKLTEMGLSTHAPYQGASLTEAGRKIALELIRHHRLLETYLHQALGYALEEVHDEAEKLEHHISEDFEARINAVLGNPTHDPHGAPIPRLDGSIPPFATRALSDVGAGEAARIGRVSETDPAFLRLVVQLGLTPGAQLEVLAVNATAGTITLLVDGETHTLGLDAAKRLWVDEMVLT